MAERQTVRFTLVAMLTLMVGCGGRGSRRSSSTPRSTTSSHVPSLSSSEQATSIVVRFGARHRRDKKHWVGQSLDCREGASAS